MFPKVPQSSLGILSVPQLPPLEHPPLGTLQFYQQKQSTKSNLPTLYQRPCKDMRFECLVQATKFEMSRHEKPIFFFVGELVTPKNWPNIKVQKILEKMIKCHQVIGLHA